MDTWNRSDLWADADARVAHRALIWRVAVPASVVAAWLILAVMRSIWDLTFVIDFVQHVP